MNITFSIIAFAISLGIGLTLIPVLVRICISKDWTDMPGHRKVHTQPIPRLGGIMFMPAMTISFLLATLALGLYEGRDTEIRLSTCCMAVGALAIYLVGLVDDFRELRANTKFIIQFAAALIFPLCNLLVGDLRGLLGIHELPFLVSYPLTVFIILLITNAMNLIDGIDGLASGLSILILTCFTFLFLEAKAYTFMLLSASTLGCLIAFFYYNVWGKVGGKKIFMGDSGSLFLGYIIAYLAIKYQMMPNEAMAGRQEPLLFAYTLVIVPTFDVIRVALTRKLHGKDMFTPDKTHIHHRIMDMGLSMHQALVAILCLFAVFCGLNYCLNGMGLALTWIAGIDIVLYSLFIGMTDFFKSHLQA